MAFLVLQLLICRFQMFLIVQLGQVELLVCKLGPGLAPPQPKLRSLLFVTHCNWLA
jgi:hypothetical protein